MTHINTNTNTYTQTQAHTQTYTYTPSIHTESIQLPSKPTCNISSTKTFIIYFRLVFVK